MEQSAQNSLPIESSTDLTSFVTRARIRDVGVVSSHLRRQISHKGNSRSAANLKGAPRTELIRFECITFDARSCPNTR